MLYIAGLELSESNEVGVKYGFILGLKELSISQFTKKKNKQTDKQTNKKKKKNKPMLELTYTYTTSNWSTVQERDIATSDHELIGQVGKKFSERYPCVTDLNYAKPLNLRGLTS